MMMTYLLKASNSIGAVAGFVANKLDKVLTIKSPRGDWEFPSGQVEKGGTLAHALKREVFEETGVIVKPMESIQIHGNHRY